MTNARKQLSDLGLSAQEVDGAPGAAQQCRLSKSARACQVLVRRGADREPRRLAREEQPRCIRIACSPEEGCACRATSIWPGAEIRQMILRMLSSD